MENDKRFNVYHSNFWGKDPLNNGMLKSAREVLPVFFKHLTKIPNSIVDIGCGKGAWLFAAKENGVKKTIGVDGPWVSSEDIPFIYNVDKYISCDLETEFPKIEKVDATICVEVAEHLSDTVSINLVNFITSFSDVVLFSSATKGQGAEHHINEQPDSYWDEKFCNFKFTRYDVMKEDLEALKETDFWYIKNCRIYAKNETLVKL